MRHLKKSLLALVLCLPMANVQASSLKFVAYINANNCTSCNALAKSLKRYPAILERMSFAFSEKMVTREQAEAFLEEVLGLHGKVTFNQSIFQVLEKKFLKSRFPQLVIFDTARNTIVYSTAIDSLQFNKEVFEKVIELTGNYVLQVNTSPRIARVIGFKNIAYGHDKLFVYAYANASKIYIYDLKNKNTDSIHISDESLQQIYGQLGIKRTVEEVRAYYKLHSIPVSMFHFTSEPYVRDSAMNMFLSIMYYDPGYTGDTLRPEWYSFIASYHIFTKKLKLTPIRSWTKNYDDDAFEYNNDPYYYPDNTIKWQLDDEHWIASSNKISRGSDTVNKTKLFIKYKYSPKEKKLVFDEIYDSVWLTNVKTFRGKHFNDYHTYHYYNYKPPYFFFNESDQVYNLAEHKQISLKEQLSGFSFIWDIGFTAKTFTVLGLENERDVVIVLMDRLTFQVIERKKIAVLDQSATMNSIKLKNGENRSVEMMYATNFLLHDGKISYINTRGEILTLEHD